MNAFLTFPFIHGSTRYLWLHSNGLGYIYIPDCWRFIIKVYISSSFLYRTRSVMIMWTLQISFYRRWPSCYHFTRWCALLTSKDIKLVDFIVSLFFFFIFFTIAWNRLSFNSTPEKKKKKRERKKLSGQLTQQDPKRDYVGPSERICSGVYILVQRIAGTTLPVHHSQVDECLRSSSFHMHNSFKYGSITDDWWSLIYT